MPAATHHESMNSFRLSTLLFLSIATACDQAAADLPEDLRSYTESDTSDETTGVSDLPAEAVWNVYDDTDAFVGELATPDPLAFMDHDDMFGPGWPRTAYLYTPDNFGFLLVTAGTAFYGPEHESMMFTGENCTGTPIDFFATYVDKPETSIVIEDCNLAGASLPDVVPHYTFTTEWLEQHWPGADGLLMPRVDGSEWYTLSFDQPWPSQRVAESERYPNGVCVDLPSRFVCAIEFSEDAWIPTSGVGPFRLIEEAAP